MQWITIKELLQVFDNSETLSELCIVKTEVEKSQATCNFTNKINIVNANAECSKNLNLLSIDSKDKENINNNTYLENKCLLCNENFISKSSDDIIYCCKKMIIHIFFIQVVL